MVSVNCLVKMLREEVIAARLANRGVIRLKKAGLPLQAESFRQLRNELMVGARGMHDHKQNILDGEEPDVDGEQRLRAMEMGM